jgi:isopropylmalate/homocitrate/citramalate synthase
MRVTVCEVGPRDGLQNEPRILPPAVRAELVNRLVVAGLRRVEVGSFVNPNRVPSMADTETVVDEIVWQDDVVYAGLVLNQRGYERLSTTRLGEVHVAFAASEAFNQRNSNASVEESVQSSIRIVERARLDGRRATVTIATAFGCPFEGAVDPAGVLRVIEMLGSQPPDEIVLADTIGVAVPSMVKQLVEAAAELQISPVGVHLHNTRNTGYANAYAAVESGSRLLDASIGGIGGCPFAPNATGNIATEDLIYLLHGEGIETGVDLDALLATVAWVEEVLGRETPGLVHRAGEYALTKETIP